MWHDNWKWAPPICVPACHRTHTSNFQIVSFHILRVVSSCQSLHIAFWFIRCKLSCWTLFNHVFLLAFSSSLRNTEKHFGFFPVRRLVLIFHWVISSSAYELSFINTVAYCRRAVVIIESSSLTNTHVLRTWLNANEATMNSIRIIVKKNIKKDENCQWRNAAIRMHFAHINAKRTRCFRFFFLALRIAAVMSHCLGTWTWTHLFARQWLTNRKISNAKNVWQWHIQNSDTHIHNCLGLPCNKWNEMIDSNLILRNLKFSSK